MKLSVIGAGIFGASRQTNLRPASGVTTAKWVNRLLSNTGILSAYRGRESLTGKPLQHQCSKESQFSRESETAATSTASIRNTSKSLSLLVR